MFSKPSFLETFKRKGKWKNFDGNINILSNINDSDISKILSEKGIHSIQLYEFTQPSKSTWQSLNKLFEKNPDIGLRVLNHEKLNFSFYELIPSVRLSFNCLVQH
ncbi:hypothetical protein BXY85_1570 [Roseivirga pacifica]|uniref:Uncharacterized protein n=1 Tax=Roseivirga pacifica TaxID=1267423 RepID=A0A1I0MN76_9BACT|nr:hypothetical protein BXY85_1570 [Roseivirga pacifica]SEV89888.1 hypothetical protein SAMN05216290_0554 [Roseivirga pacifica]